MALRARTNSGMPFGIEAGKLADGGLGDHDAGGVDAEIVAAVNQARDMPSIRMRLPFAGTMSKMMFQRSPSM